MVVAAAYEEIPKSVNDYYWATEEDPDELGKNLLLKRDRFFEFLEKSALWNRINRNYDFYHNLYPGTAGPWSEISEAGQEGQIKLISVNHFRSLLHMLITYMIQHQPAWDAKAVEFSTRAINQAKFANQLLEYIMQKEEVEIHIRKMVEGALVLTAGYMLTTWDPNKGPILNANPQDMSFQHPGDINLQVYSFPDVIYDYAVQDWGMVKWFIVHSLRNRWELAEEFYEYRDDIVQENRQKLKHDLEHSRTEVYNDSDDLVDYYEFYHEPTMALPEGRYSAMVGSKTVVLDGPNPYRCRILHRLVPAEFLLSSFGYSPGFDLQGLQEFLNSEYSTILTNHNNLGPTKLWSKSGEPLNLWELEPGTNLIQTDTEPKPLNLLATPEELLNFPSHIVKEMEYVSGINAVSRGQPEATYRSGTALAQVDAKTNQYNSPLQAALHKCLGSIGTSICHLYRDFGGMHPRMVALAGPQGESELKSFVAEDLDMIDHVVVQSGNPLMKTLSGRKEIAAELLSANLINTPHDYLTLIQTGQLQPLMDTVDSQLSLVYDENEALRRGELFPPNITDNQLMHIKKHSALIDSMDARMNSEVYDIINTHIAHHITLLNIPYCQALQIAMEYATPEQIQMLVMIGGVPPPEMMGGKPGNPNQRPEPSEPAPARNIPPAATPQTREAMAENIPEGGGE